MTTPATPPAAAGLRDADRDKIAALRRMKAIAAAFLVVALALYVLTYQFAGGGAGWLGYLRAGAEAGMVGGLADWFAVTALFRHPLGVPIPHTAIIPKRKDSIGTSLQSFVGENFLTESTVVEQLKGGRIPQRIGAWLGSVGHQERVADEAMQVAAAAVNLLADEDLQALVGQAVLRRLDGLSIGPQAGRLLAPIVADGAHHALVDVAIRRINAWLRDSPEQVMAVIERQAPEWTPRFLDRGVARRLYQELVRVAGEIERDQHNPLRLALDGFLTRLAHDLTHDADTIKRMDALVATFTGRSEVRRAFGDLVSTGRAMLLEQLDDRSGELHTRVVLGLDELSARLREDTAVQERVNGWAAQAADYVVSNYREEITRVISDTVNRWDGRETSRKLEIQVGRDLQFIRINGTVVGALAGLVIHALSTAL